MVKVGEAPKLQDLHEQLVDTERVSVGDEINVTVQYSGVVDCIDRQEITLTPLHILDGECPFGLEVQDQYLDGTEFLVIGIPIRDRPEKPSGDEMELRAGCQQEVETLICKFAEDVLHSWDDPLRSTRNVQMDLEELMSDLREVENRLLEVCPVGVRAVGVHPKVYLAQIDPVDLVEMCGAGVVFSDTDAVEDKMVAYLADESYEMACRADHVFFVQRTRQTESGKEELHILVFVDGHWRHAQIW